MRGKEAHFVHRFSVARRVVDPRWPSLDFTRFWCCGFGPIRRYDRSRLKLTTEEERARWPASARDLSAGSGTHVHTRHRSQRGAGPP